MTVTLDSISLLNHNGFQPNILRKSLTGPNDSWKKVFQITVIITGVVIIGIKKRTRKKRLKAISFQTISAKAKPKVYCKVTVVIDRKLSRPKASQNLLSSWNSRK